MTIFIPFNLKLRTISSSYLHLHRNICNITFRHVKKLFDFPIVNILFVCDNTPATHAYVSVDMVLQGLYFLDKGLLLIEKLFKQELLIERLRSPWKFFIRHNDLIDWNEISISQVRTDIFSLSWIQL